MAKYKQNAFEWAKSLLAKNSSERLVMLCLATRVNADYEAYPSFKCLLEDTLLSDKTLKKVLRDLKNRGVIKDTGKRTGRTNQVIVYRINLCPLTNSENKEEQNYTSSKEQTGVKLPVFKSETGVNLPGKGGNFAVKGGYFYPTEIYEEVNKEINNIVLPKSDPPNSRASPKKSSQPNSSPKPKPEAKTMPKKDYSVPDNFEITPRLLAWFDEKQIGQFVPDMIDETEAFLDHHRSNDNKSKITDWESGWRNWMRNAKKYAQRRQQGTNNRQQSQQSLREHNRSTDWRHRVGL